MTKKPKLHTVEGKTHKVHFVWNSSGDEGYMRIEPPVEIAKKELKDITRGFGGIDEFTMIASSFAYGVEKGGTLFRMDIDTERPPQDTRPECLIEYGEEAARILLSKADAAASAEGLKTFVANEDY